MSRVVVRRYGRVKGETAEFTEARMQLHIERKGGYIPVTEVQARADTLMVIEKPLPLPLPPLPVLP